MEEKDKKGFLVLMAMLSEAFKEEISSERAKIYFEFLKKYSIYDVMLSIKESIKKNKFFPKISDLVENIEIRNGPYQLIETPKGREGRIKSENYEVIEYITKITNIMGKPKIKEIEFKD